MTNEHEKKNHRTLKASIFSIKKQNSNFIVYKKTKILHPKPLKLRKFTVLSLDSQYTFPIV